MGDLGAFLQALHTEPPAGTVRLEVESWAHRERQAAAWQAATEKDEGTFYGGALLASGEDDAPAPPVEERRRHRSWSDGAGRRRVEEWDADGALEQLTVGDGDTWWLWRRDHGAHTNEGTPHVGGADDRAGQVVFGAWSAAGALRFVAAGDEVAGGRTARVAVGRPRPSAAGSDGWTLHRYGLGLDEIELAVDPATGTALRVESRHAGRPMERWTVTDLVFGEPLDEALFVFASPDGSVPRPFADHEPHDVPLHELAGQVDFPVWVAAGLTDSWQVRAFSFADAGSQSVTVAYHSHTAGYSFSLHQSAAENPVVGYDPRDADWTQVTAGDLTLDVFDHAGRHDGLVVVRSLRGATRIELQAHGLEADVLIEIAATLEPAPSAPPR